MIYLKNIVITARYRHKRIKIKTKWKKRISKDKILHYLQTRNSAYEQTNNNITNEAATHTKQFSKTKFNESLKLTIKKFENKKKSQVSKKWC